MSAIRDDLAEQAVRLVVRAGGEEQLAGLRRVPVAEPQTPQAVDDDRLAIGLPQLAAASAVVRVVDVDLTVAEVSNEQITAELAEVRRREGEPPRRVELAAGHQAANQSAVVGEHVDEAVPLSGHVIMQRRVLLGVGHVQLAGQSLDVEGRVTGRDLRVYEQPAGEYNGYELAVVDLDPAGPEVGRVQVGVAVGRLGDREALVDGVR